MIIQNTENFYTNEHPHIPRRDAGSERICGTNSQSKKLKSPGTHDGVIQRAWFLHRFFHR